MQGKRVLHLSQSLLHLLLQDNQVVIPSSIVVISDTREVAKHSEDGEEVFLLFTSHTQNTSPDVFLLFTSHAQNTSPDVFLRFTSHEASPEVFLIFIQHTQRLSRCLHHLFCKVVWSSLLNTHFI